MAEQLDFQSPVHGSNRTGGPLVLTDETSSTRVLVRGADAGIDLEFGSSDRRGDGVLVAATRPEEWTLIGPLADAAGIIASAQAPGFVSVLDQTHSRAMFRLAGPDSAKALEKVCSIDFGDHMTPDGAVVSASVAKVTCDLIRDDDRGVRSYLLICDRSFANYLFEVLADAGTEFGLS